jgi:hypothetical protein
VSNRRHVTAPATAFHRGHAEGVTVAALDLDARCDHNGKVDRALRRVGFTGMIGSPAL